MRGAVAISQAPETKWTVVSGPMTGTVRLMNQTQFIIGRSPECDFVIINDPKCSRRHAIVQCTMHGCEIQSLNEDNPVYINGQPVKRGRLNDNDVITLGETDVQYNQTSLPTMASVSTPQHHYAAPPSAQYGYTPSMARGKATPVKRSNSKRFIIYGVVGMILFWLLTPVKDKKKPPPLRTDKQIQADIEEAQKLKEAAEAMAQKKMDHSLIGRQAQENYVRGFRDYKKGQYERAIVSFQACLALNPSHALCNRYHRLAQRRFHELVQYQMVLGRQYRDQNQYHACRSAYRNVMVMLKDANNPTYREAKLNYEACNSFLEGRY